MILTMQIRQILTESDNIQAYRKNRQSPTPAMRENAENDIKTTSNDLTTCNLKRYSSVAEKL